VVITENISKDKAHLNSVGWIVGTSTLVATAKGKVLF
jgi:hypothetical protein